MSINKKISIFKSQFLMFENLSIENYLEIVELKIKNLKNYVPIILVIKQLSAYGGCLDMESR